MQRLDFTTDSAEELRLAHERLAEAERGLRERDERIHALDALAADAARRATEHEGVR
jgi:hypothetical protein